MHVLLSERDAMGRDEMQRGYLQPGRSLLYWYNIAHEDKKKKMERESKDADDSIDSRRRKSEHVIHSLG